MMLLSSCYTVIASVLMGDPFNAVLSYRLRGPVSVMAGRVRTPLRRPPGWTSSPTQSTCRSPAVAAPIRWVGFRGERGDGDGEGREITGGVLWVSEAGKEGEM